MRDDTGDAAMSEWDPRYGMDIHGRLRELADVRDTSFPVRCTRCSKVYDLGKVTVVARYTDCSVWKCPGCGCTVDDRPAGWGDHHYVELDFNGREKRNR